MFVQESVSDSLLNLTWDDRRGEVRFPSSLRVRINGKDATIEGRLTDYSLHGLAVHTDAPLKIGSKYKVEVANTTSPLNVHATCQWSIETGYGYVSGCSIAPYEGVLLAGRGLDETLLPWEITRTHEQDRGETRSPMAFGLANKVARHNARLGRPTQKPVVGAIARLWVLSLATLLLVMGISGAAAPLVFIAGLLGLVAFLGLSIGPWQQKDEASRLSLVSLSRLRKHLVRLPSDET